LDLQQTGFVPQADLPVAAVELRAAVMAAFENSPKRTAIDQDKAMGLALYSALSPERFSMRAAADDGVWRFLSLDVFPDFVHRRSPSGDAAWFWSSRWRVWLKRTWWLIHLSWQGNELETSRVLKNWTTDTIAQFVERPGLGFRVDLWRGIALEHSRRRLSEKQFRGVMKLNTAFLAASDPSISQDLIGPYVITLFENVLAAR